jgi:hypothetical protein
MGRRIFKYPVEMRDHFQISLPEGADILAVQVQRDQPVMWALVDPEKPLTQRWFRVAGTGHLIEEDHLGHIGTFQLYAGDLVFHLFEVRA